MIKILNINVKLDIDIPTKDDIYQQYSISKLIHASSQIIDHKAQLILKKEILRKIDTVETLGTIVSAEIACKDFIISNKPTCATAKAHACKKIKAFTAKVTEYNNLLPAYVDNADYSQLQAYDSDGLEPLNATVLLGGQKSLDDMSCDQT